MREVRRDPPAAPGPRATTPLLSLITQQSLDEDYLHVAERRSSAAPAPPRRGSHKTAAVVAVVFGILVSTAAVQTSRNAGAEDAGRATLISQITARGETVSRLQERIVELRERNVELDEELGQVTRAQQATTARLRRLEAVTGYGAVTGPGVRFVVDDAPNGDATQVVRDEDLRLLVNGLWSAGAEAISLNGRRLTALSAIRNVDIAVHVNTRPLSPPYVVLAVGNPQTLPAMLLESTHGQAWYSLVDQLGFRFDMDNEDSLALPAAQLRPLRDVVAGSAENPDQRMNEETTS